MTTILLIHGNPAVGPLIQERVPGAKVAVIYRPGGASAYGEQGLLREYPTLGELARAFVPSWSPQEPLVVMAFSAGGWALRAYLRDANSRAQAAGVGFLDATYGAPGGECDLGPYQGVIEYAQTGKPLILTSSTAHPDPAICALAIALRAGAGTVENYQGSHDAQQYEVAPDVAARLAQGLESKKTKRRGWGTVLLGVAAGIVGLAWWRSRR